MAGTLLCACFENDSEVGAGRGTPWSDIRIQRVLSFHYIIIIYWFFMSYNHSCQCKGSDLNSQSENVWFSCLKSSYCIQRAKSGWEWVM